MKTEPQASNSGLILNDNDQQLKAAAGEIILLTGAVGSGKSLWLHRLAGLTDLPAHISSMIGGKPVAKARGSALMLFDRQPQLWLGQTVAEELCFGLKERPEPETLHTVLSQWGLSELDLGSDLATLNRLQGVRLSLASISLAAPKLALLDNPTDALPEQDAFTLRDDISAWASHSVTTVVVTSNRWHDWRSVATQNWWIGDADKLPQWGEIQT